MGSFNFSNVNNTSTQNEYRDIPLEFRDAVKEAKDAPLAPIAQAAKDNAPASNYMPGGSNGFIDETGTWNDGSSLYQYKTNDTEWNQSVAGQLANSNAYKKYVYSREDVLKEASSMSKDLNIPVDAILKDENTLAKTREVYNFKNRQLDKNEVFKAYPELAKIAELDDTDAAIALHNLSNVKETKGIIEAAKAGYELFSLSGERGRIGIKALEGKELTPSEANRLEEIEKRMQDMPQLPGFMEHPIDAIAGGTVQTGALMLRGIISGQKWGAIGGAAGALIGAAGAGSATLGTGTAAGAIAGAKAGYSIGSRIGMAEDMFSEIQGNNYLDFLKYKDKDGKQLLTDNEARFWAFNSALSETFIEMSNVENVFTVAKSDYNKAVLKAIAKAARDNEELKTLITGAVTRGIKNTAKVALPEMGEEALQEASNRVISNLMAELHPGGDIPTYDAKEVILGAIEASWQALPASLGLGLAAQGASTVGVARRAAALMSIKEEAEKEAYLNANGRDMLRALGEHIKSSDFFKKNPEVASKVIAEQLKGSNMENVTIDTDMVLNQEGGYETLKDVAAKAGISEERFNQIIENRTDMEVPTAIYAQQVLSEEAGKKLENYITFDSMGECLARSRQYAARIKRMQDEIMSLDSKRREEALQNFLDANFPDESQREVAEALLMRFADNPAEGVKEMRKEIKGKINAMLEPVLTALRDGMGNGTVIAQYVDFNGDPTTPEYAHHGKRASLNDAWYSKWAKEHNYRQPTLFELEGIARDVLTGIRTYVPKGWEYDGPEMQEWYDGNKAQLEALDESLERLNNLAPRLEKIDPGELTITEGLSKEGFEVYKNRFKELSAGPSKQAKMAARMGAILYACMADRMADLHREMGHKKYTALDFDKQLRISMGVESRAGLFNQAAMKRQTFNNIEEFDGAVKKAGNSLSKLGYWLIDNENTQLVLSGSSYKHIQEGKHPLTTEQWKNFINSIDKIDALESISYVEGEKGSFGGIPIGIKLNTDLGTAGAIVEFIPNGKAFIVTIAYNNNEAIDNWLKKKKNSRTLEVGDILPQNRITGSSSIKIIQDEISKVNKSFNQVAYHGTGSIFNTFDLGYAGSGEGGSAHGWGVYVAKDKNTAIGYRNLLAGNVKYYVKNKPLEDVYKELEQKGDYDKMSVVEEFLVNQNEDNILEDEYTFTPEAIKWFKDKVLPHLNSKKKHGALMEVEVPENDVLLDEQKTYSEQTPKVKSGINSTLNKLSEEQKDVFKNIYIENSIHKEGTSPERDALLDEQHKAQGLLRCFMAAGKEPPTSPFALKAYNKRLEELAIAGYNAEELKGDKELREKLIKEQETRLADLESKLKAEELERQERYETQKSAAQAKSLEELLPGMTGEQIYTGLFMALNESPKAASLMLNANGVKGITYDGKTDGRCYVVFDDKAVGTIKSFNQAAGENSSLSRVQLRNLNRAKSMAAEGKYSKEEILKDTGWYKGVDNLWRYEIPDNLDKIDATKFPKSFNRPVVLSDIYQNDFLYESYPWLAKLPIFAEEMAGAKGYANGTKKIALNVELMGDEREQIISIDGEDYVRTTDIKGDYVRNNFKDSSGKKLRNDNEYIEYGISKGIIKQDLEDPFNIDASEGPGICYSKAQALAALDNLIAIAEKNIETLSKDEDNDWLIDGENRRLEKLYEAINYVSDAEVKVKDNAVIINKRKAKENLSKTLIHEIQHIIQNEEGFAVGGNPGAVNRQITTQARNFREEADNISIFAASYRDARKKYYALMHDSIRGKVSAEEVQKYKNEVLEAYPYNTISEKDKRRIWNLYAMAARLEDLRDNPAKDNVQKYFDLAGEQEARAAADKAITYTDIVDKREALLTGEQIFEKYKDQVKPEHIELVKEYIEKYQLSAQIALGNIEMEEDELAKLNNRMDELQNILVHDRGYHKIDNAIERAFMAEYELPNLEEQLRTQILEGVNEIDAIVVFNGSEVGGFNIERLNSTIKGQTALMKNGERVITLFNAADQSTFMHEAAHLYLSEMVALANMQGAPERLIKDVKTIHDWASWKDGQLDEYNGSHLEQEFKVLDAAIRKALETGSAEYNGKTVALKELQEIWLQERFARGFENYLKTGKAPTSSLRSVFYRFKKWLSNIYKDFKKLGGAPTKEVAQVMDRMLATEDEIDIELKKRGVNDFVKAGGLDYLSEDSQALYNRMLERAREEAEANVLKTAMQDIRDNYDKEREESIKAVERDVRENLSKEPVFLVAEHMKNNPGLSLAAVCEAMGITEKEYQEQLASYGGSLEEAVSREVKDYAGDPADSVLSEEEVRKRAEEKVQEDYYRKLVTALELNAFENIAKAQKALNRKAAKELKDAPTQDVNKAMKALSSREKAAVGLRAIRDAAEGHYRDYVEYVKSKLEDMPIKDANNYKMWRKKSSQALDAANMAMTKGEWERAVNFKRQQLIYDLFADEAVKSRSYTEKLVESLIKKQAVMTKNNKMPADERYVYNHLLYVFGFTKKQPPVPPEYKDFTTTLMRRDETLECPFVNESGQLDLPEWLLHAGTGTQVREAGHSDLSLKQLKDLAMLMKVIYKTGMESDKLRTAKDIHGNTVGLLDAISQIAREAEERVLPKNNKDITGAEGRTKLEAALDAANAAHIALIKPETIFRELGPAAMRYIYEPLKAAADKELRLSSDVQNKLAELFKVYSKDELYEMRTKKQYKLGTSMLTKERLIMLGLNWGTYISQQRIMAGHNVSSYEVVEVLSNLEERDWKFIEGVWGLYEEHWPELQAVEARITGAVLEKQEPFPFDILGKDGKYYRIQGGYFPLKYDASKNASVSERAEDVAKQASMASFALSIGRSMTKERSQGKVALPLDLRFDIISKTLSDEVHLVSFREPIRDVRRIILNGDFEAVVQRLYGLNTVLMLRKWSADCWAQEPRSQTGYEKVLSMVRGNTTMAVLGYRTMTAILNVLNITPMAHYVGGVGEAVRAMRRFYERPREMAAFISNESVFMAERAQTMDVNIREALERGTTADRIPGYKAVQQNAFKIIAMTDLSIAYPLWLHEYEKGYQKAMENGLQPDSARREGVMTGDAAVRRVFGSSQKIDLSAVQRGSEVMKCMTMYYSYFSTLYNALAYMAYETRQKVRRTKIKAGSWKSAIKNDKEALIKGFGPLASGYLMWVLIPALLETLIRGSADDDDDKWKLEKLANKFGASVVGNTVGGIPLLRDAVPYLMARVFDQPQYGMGSLPAYASVEQLNKVISSIESDKKTKYDVARDSLRLGGTYIGFSQTLSDGLVTTIEWAGTDFEASLADYLKALVFDKRLNKK